MSSISIHNLDLSIEQKVKQLAEEKQQSINKTVKEILAARFETPAYKIGNNKRFEKFCGIWSDQEYEDFELKATYGFNQSSAFKPGISLKTL